MSQKPTHDHIEELLKRIVLPFYHIKRDMPLPLGERRWENDAEHSWSVAFLSCALAPEVDPSLDVGKVSQLALVHDIVEIYAGDTSVFAAEGELASKSEREAAAMERIKQDFIHFSWIVSMVQEYEEKATAEAKFVYAVDKYIALMYDYIDEGQLFRERKMTLDTYHKSLTHHRHKAHSHSEIGIYYDKVRDLLSSHPEFFHQEEEAAL